MKRAKASEARPWSYLPVYKRQSVVHRTFQQAMVNATLGKFASPEAARMTKGIVAEEAPDPQIEISHEAVNAILTAILADMGPCPMPHSFEHHVQKIKFV